MSLTRRKAYPPNLFCNLSTANKVSKTKEIYELKKKYLPYYY